MQIMISIVLVVNGHLKNRILRQAVEDNQGRNWKKISESIPGRTDVQCLNRSLKLFEPDDDDDDDAAADDDDDEGDYFTYIRANKLFSNIFKISKYESNSFPADDNDDDSDDDDNDDNDDSNADDNDHGHLMKII